MSSHDIMESHGNREDAPPSGGSNPFRVSRCRKPKTGRSTVRQIASYPASTTRASMSIVTVRSSNTYSCHHFGAWDAADTSSNTSTAVEETTMIVPAAAAARAVARSPSGCAIDWYAHGATSTGKDSDVPRIVVDGSGWPDPRKTLGRSLHRSNARRFSASVHSSPAPPA